MSTDEELTREIADRIATARRDLEVTILETPRTIEITGEALGRSEVSLDNLVDECARDPDAAERAKRHFVGAILEALARLTGGALEARPEQVRAVVHERAWLDGLGAGASELVHRPLAGDLHVVFVVDHPRSYGLLTRADAARLELDDASVERLAQSNMERALAATDAEPWDAYPGVAFVAADDGYVAARLVLHRRWAALAARVDGDLLVSAPSRDTVLVAGAANRAHVAALRAATDELFTTEHHPISRSLLRWTEAGWELFDEAASDSPLAPAKPWWRFWR